MTKLELQNKIATIEKSMGIITNPAVLAIAEENLKQAREQLAALEGATPSPAPSGGGSELEMLYEKRKKLEKGLESSNAFVQKASRMALPKVEAKIAELEGAKPAPAPARRMPKPKAEKPAKAPAKRGRKPKAQAPVEEKPKIKRGRKPKAETPAEAPAKIPAKRGRKPKAQSPAEVPAKTPSKRGRKPKAQEPVEVPAITPARRGRPALPKGAKSKEVSLNSLTKLANAIVEFCGENGIANPTLDDVRGILNILDKSKALKFAKGGKISRSGKYLSKWQIKQILTDGGMKIGSDEILSGVWLKKKVDGIAEMRMGGEVGYFVIDDDILESGKSVMLGNRRISAKNKKFQGVFEGKMVGGLMKVYDYDDEMWKVVNPDEWQQAYAEGGGVGNSTITDLADFDPETTLVFDGDANFEDFPEITYLGNLQEIKGDGNFRNSQVQHLGNLQTIGGYTDFMNSRVQHLGNLQTIGDSADFEDSEVQNLGNLQTIGGNANFQNSKIRNLGKLQTIGHTALFQDSQVQNLGNLQTIVGSAFFQDSIVKRLGNLQTIGGKTIFGNRIDLEAEWKARQGEMNSSKRK